MKKIIENWLANNIRTPADAEMYEQNRTAPQQAAVAASDDHSYDLNKLLQHAKNNIPNLNGGSR